MIKVMEVLDNSIASDNGIKVGDIIESINNVPFNDILDLIYAESEEELEIKKNNEIIHISKEAYEPLGLNFGDEINLKPRHCKNKCKFCFVDQLPKNMRETLYVKDDDYRYSFTTGSYITTTNLTETDIERIIKYKISPLYLSVHAFDDETRKFLVTNPNTDRMFDIIKRFTDNGIKLHTQVVMCENLNDKEILKQTMTELFKFYPNVMSLAIVPVGLTKHRENLYDVQLVSKENAINTVKMVEGFNLEKGVNFAWCSDEMYLKAGLELPPYEYYGDFAQIENGIGLIRDFESGITFDKKGTGEFHIATGVSFYPVLKGIAEKLEKSSGVKLVVHKIINYFFGETITVAGLLTGKDIVSQLKGKVTDKNLILPSTILREFEDVLLDGTTLDELSQELDCDIYVCHDGKDLEEIITGDKDE